MRWSASFLGRGLIRLFSSAAVAVSVLILGIPLAALLWTAADFLSGISLLDLLLDRTWTPGFAVPQFGLLSLVVGTFQVAVVALLTGGIGGVLLGWWSVAAREDFVRRRLGKWIGWYSVTPGLAWAFLLLVFLIPLLRAVLLQVGVELGGYSGLAGGLGVGTVILPGVASRVRRRARDGVSRWSLSAVGLGLPNHVVTRTIVWRDVSAALGPVMLLALAEAVAESVVVTLVAGQTPRSGLSLSQPVQTMGAFLVQTSLGDVSPGSPGRGPVAFVAFLLSAVCALFFASAKCGGRLGCFIKEDTSSNSIPASVWKHPEEYLRRPEKRGKGGWAYTAAWGAGLPALVLWISLVGYALAGAAGWLRGTLSSTGASFQMPSVLWGGLWLVLLSTAGAAVLSMGLLLWEAPRSDYEKYRFTQALGVWIERARSVPPVVWGVSVVCALPWVDGAAGSLGGGVWALLCCLLPYGLRNMRKTAGRVPSSVWTAAAGLGLDRKIVWRDLILSYPKRTLLGTVIETAAARMSEAGPILIVGAVVLVTFPPMSFSDPLATAPSHVFFWLTRLEAGFGGAAALLLCLWFGAAQLLRWWGRRLQSTGARSRPW